MGLAHIYEKAINLYVAEKEETRGSCCKNEVIRCIKRLVSLLSEAVWPQKCKNSRG
jgi:hypothetical protein